MEDIKQLDRKIWLRELLSPAQILCWATAGFFGWLFARAAGIPFPIVLGGVGALWVYSSYASSRKKLFVNSRFELLWHACQDRFRRFHEAISAIRKHKVAQFEEMPRTIESVHANLYIALRRADATYHEVTKSEGWLLLSSPPAPPPVSGDPQAQELYRLADKNVAEYRKHFAEVMAGVRRAEAQAAVFTTTLDTLRMKMLGYRLTGKRNEMDTQEFLMTITEAKMQLEAIDKALDELDLTPFPKTISVIPEPVQEIRG